MSYALLIIDWQNEWIKNDSPYYIGSDIKIETDKINSLIDIIRKKNGKIIFIRHIETDENAFLDKEFGSELIPSLHKEKEDIVIKKYAISPFYNTNLHLELNNFDNLIIVGGLINACVRSTICDAYDRGYKITVVTDCCIAFEKEIFDFTIKDIGFVRPEIKFCKLKEYEF